jgi:hypothetical protein
MLLEASGYWLLGFGLNYTQIQPARAYFMSAEGRRKRQMLNGQMGSI